MLHEISTAMQDFFLIRWLGRLHYEANSNSQVNTSFGKDPVQKSENQEITTIPGTSLRLFYYFIF
jgi:hypothetical protein